MKTTSIISIIILIIIAIGIGFLFSKKDAPQDTFTEETLPLQDIIIPEDSAEITQNTLPITENKKNMQATFVTNKGTIVITFKPEQAPNTVANFTKLASEGFYNGTRFHRVIEGFMVQGGDPQSVDVNLKDRWGTGGPGYTFNDEITAENKNNIGTIAMANAGPNTNGSQFFINVANNNFLDGKHTVFGEVTEGMDIVTAISKVNTDGRDRPLDDVIIESVTIK